MYNYWYNYLRRPSLSRLHAYDNQPQVTFNVILSKFQIKCIVSFWFLFQLAFQILCWNGYHSSESFWKAKYRREVSKRRYIYERRNRVEVPIHNNILSPPSPRFSKVSMTTEWFIYHFRPPNDLAIKGQAYRMCVKVTVTACIIYWAISNITNSLPGHVSWASAPAASPSPPCSSGRSTSPGRSRGWRWVRSCSPPHSLLAWQVHRVVLYKVHGPNQTFSRVPDRGC